MSVAGSPPIGCLPALQAPKFAASEDGFETLYVGRLRSVSDAIFGSFESAERALPARGV